MRAPKVMRLAVAAVLLLAAAGSARADLNPFGSYWDNIARLAAKNDANRIRTLVGTGSNPNETDEEGRTGLHNAALNGSVQICAILIRAGAKLSPVDKLGNTPLHYAAERNQVEVAKLLIASKAVLDAENKGGMTPLMLAASKGNLDIVQALLASGASTAKLDYTGRDAAGWALESHRPAVLQAIKRAALATR